MLGFTGVSIVPIQRSVDDSPTRLASVHRVSIVPDYQTRSPLTNLLPKPLSVSLNPHPFAQPTFGARWYFVWSADIGSCLTAVFAAFRRTAVALDIVADVLGLVETERKGERQVYS